MQYLGTAALAASLAVCAQATAQDARDDEQILKHLKPTDIVRFAASNEKTKIDHTLFLNPNCAAAGKIFVKVLKKPQHGDVIVADEEGYSNFSEKNLRAKCNAVLSPITSVYYVSHRDYVGEDSMQLLFLYQGNGSADLENVTVLVR